MQDGQQLRKGKESVFVGDSAGSYESSESDRCLEIAVVFTSAEGTRLALKQAVALQKGLDGRIVLIAAQVVPYPLPLEHPPISLDFTKKQLQEIAGTSPLPTAVRISLCRSRLEALSSQLKQESLVVIGGRRSWWRTWERTLARRLQRIGRRTIFFEA